MQSEKSLATTELRHRLLPAERPVGSGAPQDRLAFFKYAATRPLAKNDDTRA